MVVVVVVQEIIKESVDPQWTKEFVVDYNFECIQEFCAKIYHHDGSHPVEDLARHKLVGSASFRLSNLMREQKLALSMPDANSTTARMEVRGETLSNTRDNFVVTFSGLRLLNKEGFFSTSDPFLQISRLNEDGAWTVVWKNQHIPSTLNPHWSVAKIPMTVLCNGDIDRPVRIEVLDWEKSGKHVAMGEVETNVRQMLTFNGRGLDIIEPAKRAKNKKYVNSGVLVAGSPGIEHNPTFGDYIKGKCELSLVIGIDFTASNKDIHQADSLHHLDYSELTMNPYQSALQSICQILEPYDSDNLYPVYGFGAKVRLPEGGYSPAQHCFPIYAGGAEAKGTAGVLAAYRDALPAVMLSGPTLFAPIINHAAQLAAASACSQHNQKYTILLLITDGEVNDMAMTKEAIIRASNQPMSIIIIGVGPADFSSMHELDADEALLSAGSLTAARDIVQFVAYRDLIGRGTEALAQAVLAEVPTQMLLYMKQQDILPNTELFKQMIDMKK